MVTLENALLEDVQQCYDIIDIGRKFQQEQGFEQWTEDYPNFNIIRDDILNKKGYVVKVDGTIAGYMCIDFDGESAYDNIDGKWNLDAPFAVVHRMAFSTQYRGIGLSDTAWKLIKEYCKKKNVGYIRVDTDFPNKRMQHILEKNGFKRCGIIVFQGSGKIAYDKVF
ncbi:MAG: GNAT family N-acetyltransferase [Candidatus Ornithomonoglobus sp.]